jgi:hypothetical protein
MKNKLLAFFAVLLFPSACFAQITINKSDMPSAGDTLRLSTSTPSQSINLNQTGANYTWDFSQLQPINQTIDTFFAMSALPKSYYLFFSGGSFATHTNVPDSIGPITLTNVYTIYQLNSSEYGGLGVGEEIDGLPTPIAYDSLDVLYTFPLNFGDVDSSHTSYAIPIPTIGFIGEKRKRVNECDGWGTLTTPYGTFNVLRVKSTLESIDSIYVNALSFGISIPSVTYQYKWLAKGEGEPILEIDAADVLDSPVITEISYRDSDRTKSAGINKPASQDGLTIFPNPVSNKLNFSTTASSLVTMRLSIYSVYGIPVYHQTDFTENTTCIDIANLPSGIYIAELIQGNELFYKKFIIVH